MNLKLISEKIVQLNLTLSIYHWADSMSGTFHADIKGQRLGVTIETTGTGADIEAAVEDAYRKFFKVVNEGMEDVAGELLGLNKPVETEEVFEEDIPR